MKKILLFALCLITVNAHAGVLEAFFSKLEGHWDLSSAESFRETPSGEFSRSEATHFVADVIRTGNDWKFSEEVCWSEEGESPACGESFLTYQVEGDSLFVTIGDEKYPVDVLEIDEEFMMMMVTTAEFGFTAMLTIEEKNLSQESVFEMNDGTKEYQFLKLRSH